MAINDYVREGAFILSGIGLAVQLALPNHALGEDFYKVAKTPISHTRYEDTNLASLGVPNWEGLTPMGKPREVNKNKSIPGNESLFTTYNANGMMVGSITYNGIVYGLTMDSDWKPPLETMLLDKNGKGRFEHINPQTDFFMPDWVAK